MTLQKTPLSPSPANTFSPVPPAPLAVKPPVGQKVASRIPFLPFWVGLTVSIAWVCVVFALIAKAGPTHDLAGVPLVDWAIGISAAVSPVAMVWMITAYLQRASDIRTIADPLRRQLTLITGESGAADARIRRFNQAIKEQLDLLRNAQTVSQDDMESVADRVQKYRGELERLESASSHQVAEIQDVIRRSMQQIEKTMEDKFSMLRVLDGKLQQNGDGVARQVEGVSGNISKMLQEIEQSSAQVADALDRAQRDSRKLADTSRLQEASLTNAASVASETLGGLSGKIDLSVTRFLERASTAREEAERLAHALDAQTRALDEFSSTLPVRVSEAESVLRGVADRLYASEQLACEQAMSLSEKLSYQVDGLQGFMDRFTARMTDIDTGLERRGVDLSGLAERIGNSASGFVASWEQSLTSLNDRTGNVLLRFTVVNDETRRNAEEVAAHLSETTGKYEDVVIRMRSLSSESGTQMKEMTEEATRYFAQFDALSKATNQAGEEVQQRAHIALQNLQHVLERVLMARDATQSIGETLVKDICAAVEQNEKMIARLNETAQIGARTIGVATETLGRQEGILVGKMREGEVALLDSVQKMQQQAEVAGAGLREQTAHLKSLLVETQTQLASTDQKLKSFAAQAIAPVQAAVKQIDVSADNGLRTISQYGEGVSQQVNRLQEFNTRIGGMSQEMGKTTAQTVGVLENLSERFSTARANQEEAARQTLSQFSDLSDRLQREVGGLDNQTARAVEILQESALKVGEQSYQMLEKAQTSSAQIKDIAAVLQAESTQIQNILSRQTEEIRIDLAQAEQKFATLGESIRERADTTVEILDRAANSYGIVSQTIEQTVGSAQIKVEGLHAALACQADRIGEDAAKIEAHTSVIASNSGHAVQNLSILNDKLSVTRDTVVISAQQSLDKLDECSTSFQRRAVDVAKAAQMASEAVTKAGIAFGEQSGKLVDGGQQIDGILRQLTTATSVLTDQAAQIRVGMEQQNGRLLSQLADAVAQLDVTGSRLQYVVSAAVQGADQASARFADMTETASYRIGVSAQDLQNISERVDANLSALGANVTQQAASLSIVGEQISEQQRLLAIANEQQRVEMLGLFDKLGEAHAQASQIAERSISHLTESLQDIQREMGIVDDRSQEVVGNVKIAGQGFSEQASSLLQNAQAAEQQARTILSATAALQEQARHLRESLQTESDRAGESLGSLIERLTVGGTTVRQIGVDTSAVMTVLHKAMGEQAQELGSTMNQIGERQRSLTVTLDEQREVINSLVNRLTLAQDETVEVAERTAARLSEETKNITRTVEALDERAQTALLNVKATTVGFVQEADIIDMHANQAEQRAQAVVATAAGLHGQIHDLRVVMHKDCEETTQALDGLLRRVTTGSHEIKEAGVVAETTLASLHQTLGDQTNDLGASINQISERQRSMTADLDAQRGVVDSLMNRLSVAQDETAAVAERTVARLNEGTQQITKQIDMIGEHASQTLTSVQSSVSGLSEQTSALNMQGLQAEQQMRGLLSVTAGMQEQAYHLREAMQVETARIIENLTSVIAQLDKTNSQVKTESSEAVQSLDHTAQRFTVATDAGVEMIRQQLELLARTADQSDARMNNAGEKMRTHLRLVGEIGDQAETQARRLADSSEFATTRLVSLRDTLGISDKESGVIVEGVHQRIADVKSALQGALQHLADLSQQSVEQVSGAVQTLATQSDVLRANLASSESALTTAASLVREENGQLPSLLSRSVGEIENATRALKGQAAEADQAMIGTADRFISVTATARNNMIEEMNRVSGVADDADKILRSFGQSLAEQIVVMQQGAASLSNEQKDLVEKANVSVGVLAQASDRLSALRSEASTTAQRLVQDFDALDKRAIATNDVLTQTGSTIVKQTDAIAEATVRAESQMAAVSNGLREQLDRIRAGLQGQIDDIAHGLMQITTQLERTGASLRTTTVGALSDVETIGQHFQQSSDQAAVQIDTRMHRMQAVTEEMDQSLAIFGGKFNSMLDQMALAGDGIKNQEGDILSRVQGMLSHLGSVAAKMDDTRTMSSNVSQHAIERLDEVINAVQAQMNNMTAGAQTAAGVMRSIGQIYNDQTQSLSKGVGDAHQQVLTMNDSIGDMQQRTDRMRVALKLQGDELMSSLRQILIQLEVTGDGLSEAVDNAMQQKAMSGLQKIN